MRNMELDVLWLESTRDLISMSLNILESNSIVVDDDESVKMRIKTIHFFSEISDYNRTFKEATELYVAVTNKCR